MQFREVKQLSAVVTTCYYLLSSPNSCCRQATQKVRCSLEELSEDSDFVIRCKLPRHITPERYAMLVELIKGYPRLKNRPRVEITIYVLFDASAKLLAPASFSGCFISD